MFASQNVRYIMLQPSVYTAGATASFIVDRRGYEEASFLVVQGNAGATTKATVLTISDSDATDATTFSTITGYNGGTAATNSWITPNAVTDATAVPPMILNVDCLGKKRYLRLQMSPGTTQVIGVVAALGRPANAPDSLGEILGSQGTNGAHGSITTATGLVVNPDGRAVV